MFEKLLKRLCPCYFVDADESDLRSDLVDRSGDFRNGEFDEKSDSCNQENDFVEKFGGHQLRNEEWTANFNAVRPQPMYAVPDDWGEFTEKDFSKPAMCWRKAAKSLNPKGPAVFEKTRASDSKKPILDHRGVVPFKSKSAVLSSKPKKANLNSSIKSGNTVHSFKSQSLHNISFKNSSHRKDSTLKRNELIGDRLYREKPNQSPKKSNGGEKWYFVEDREVFPDISHGVVFFTAAYFHRKKTFLVNIHRLENLPKKGKEGLPYHSIMKIMILPSEKYVKSTRLLERCGNPEVNEDFSFSVKDLTGRTLRLSVFDASFQKQSDAIGHALLRLENVASGQPKKYRIKLYRQSQPDSTTGSLAMSLVHKPDEQKFTVMVDKAKNLNLQKDRRVKLNTYVKITLYSYGEKVKTKKSSVVADSREPNYNSAFTFHVREDQIDHLSIVVAIKLKSFVKDLSIGKLIFGPFFVSERQNLTPWGKVFLKREFVSHWFRMYL